MSPKRNENREFWRLCGLQTKERRRREREREERNRRGRNRVIVIENSFLSSFSSLCFLLNDSSFFRPEMCKLPVFSKNVDCNVAFSEGPMDSSADRGAVMMSV